MRENRRYWRDLNHCGNGVGYDEYDDCSDYDRDDDYYSDSDDNNGDSNDCDGY